MFTWIIVAIEFMNDKEKYLFTKRKLDPQSGGTIGHLNDVMYFVSWMACLINVALAVYEISKDRFTDRTTKVQNKGHTAFFFLAIFILSMIVKYLVVDMFWYGDLPEKYQAM